MSSLLVDLTTASELLINSSSNSSGNETAGESGWQSSVSLNYPLGMMIVVAVLLFVVIVGTATGNLFVVIALVRYRNLRTVSNYLIGNLAASDFLLATTILPLSTVNECLGYWVFGRTACEIWLTLDVLYCTASIWNLCVIALDRFTATMYPVWYRGRRSAELQAGIYAMVVWCVAAVICVPPLLGWKESPNANYKYDAINDVHECVLFQTRGYVIYSASGSFFVPLVVTLFFYTSIFVIIHRRMRKTRAARAARSRTDPSTTKPSASLKEFQPTSPKSGFATTTLTVVDVEMSSLSCSNVDVSTGEALSLPVDQQAAATAGDPDHTILVDADDEVADEKTRLSIPTVVVKEDASPSQTLLVPDAARENGGGLTVRYGLVPSEPDLDTVSIRSFNDSTKRSRLTPNRLSFLALKNAFNARQAGLGAAGRRLRSIDQREMRATVRMAIIIAFFCGFWLGFFVVYVIHGCCPDCYVPRELDAFFFWLGYANSSVNPILYTIFNDEFRRAFLRILGCRLAGARKR